jgi:hypothetical protein
MMPSAAEVEAKQKAAEEDKKKAAAEEQKKKLAAALVLKTTSFEQAAKGKSSDEQATTGFVTIHWSRLFFLFCNHNSPCCCNYTLLRLAIINNQITKQFQPHILQSRRNHK